MTHEPAREVFLEALRTALNHLYEPRVLRAGPLPALFDLADRSQGAAALQRLLTDAIEALRPGAETPQDSGQWRAYQILRRRYTEQVPQTTVAADLGLSVRHVQREEKEARELLTEYLWQTYRLAERRHLLIGAAVSTDAGSPEAPTRVQELEALRDSDPPRITEVEALVRRSLETAQPLLQKLGVGCRLDLAANLPAAWVRPLLVEQGLINVLAVIAEARAGALLQVTVAADADAITVTLDGHGAADFPAADLDMARRLIVLAGGALAPADDESPKVNLPITVRLPQARQKTVLLIDDNVDALQLLQRYLNGVNYRAVVLSDPTQAIALAEEVQPQAILLDVMMPGRDGWALLGQLREHPQLQHTAIIVCTVLPQEHLARTLGATAFLRKPVSRADLLATLASVTAPAQIADS